MVDSHAALSGRRILVTRALDQAQEMVDRIGYYGGTPVHVPVITYQGVDETASEHQAWNESVRQANWVMLTSQNALDFLMKQTDRDSLTEVKWACVGKKTAQRLETYGFQADFQPREFTAAQLTQSFVAVHPEAARIVVPLGSLSGTTWLAPLRQIAAVTTRVVYETLPYAASREQLQALVSSGKLDALAFASPSAVSFFTQLLDAKQWHYAFNHCLSAAIGPSTARAIEKIGYFPEVIPTNHTARALIDALADYYSKEKEVF